MNKDIFNAINKVLMKLMNTSALFGGKVMVLSGDFRQTLPVLEGVNSEVLISESSLLTEELFLNNFKKMKLRTNMRARTEDEDFKIWLMKIGSGRFMEE